MEYFNILICDKNGNKYDELCLKSDELQTKFETCDTTDSAINNNELVKCKKMRIDAAFLHYLAKELDLSDTFRISFVNKFLKNSVNSLLFILKPTKKDLIDYRWNDIVYYLVRERCELDHALSWLSTLGGAFSALGDYFQNCAETAGKISLNQLQLAHRLGDPNIASRCRLYLSLSLIQKKKYKLAKRIVRREYEMAKTGPVVDERLIKMCKGIWAKLQYEHELYMKCKNKNKKS